MLNRISIDGYFASPNEANFGMDWFIHDPEVDQAAHGIGGKMDTLLMGATTYRGFARNWVPLLKDPDAPRHLKETAEELNTMTKIVFSRSIEQADWANTRIYRENLIEVVKRLKQSSGSDMLVLGSGSVVRQLAQEGLIDEFIFIVTPVVAGEGKPLFPSVRTFDLMPVEARTFQSGNMLLHYVLKK